MSVCKSEVKRNPWASQVRVSRTRDGCWVLDRVQSLSICPANFFECWDHAEWTANQWANDEYLQRLEEQAEERA